jgi:hypothetical protein
LGCKHATCLVFRFGVTGRETAYLRRFVAIDDQDSIYTIFQAGIDEKRYDNDLIVTLSLICQAVASCSAIRLAASFVLNARVHYGLEPFPCRIIGKHKFAQGSAIQVSIAVDERFAERRSNFVKCGLAWRYDLTRDDVGIDDRRAELGKDVRDRGLATR